MASTPCILANMSYLIGADEAGYGPNLGPLVVSATVWKVDGRPTEVDLYESLAEVVTAEPSRGKRDERIAVADSKALYKPRGTLRLLERGLLPMLAQLEHPAEDWSGLWNALQADPHEARNQIPWYQDFQNRFADRPHERRTRRTLWPSRSLLSIRECTPVGYSFASGLSGRI